MDRSIVYTQEQGRSTDFLFAQRSGLIALSKLAAALFGQQNFVNGLSVSPSSPAALTVQVAPGEMYAMEDVDATAYGVLAADTTHQILKQGILMDAATLACAAPTTSGYSINYLIEASFVEADTTNVVLPYFNSANPSQPLSGQNNSGTPQATERQGQVQLVAKAGTAATTGTQSTPSPDSGYVGLAVVTVAYGQSTITSGNIAPYTGTPSIAASGALAAIRKGFYSKSVAGNANVTLDPNGEAPYPIIKLTGALTGNINLYLPANGQWMIQNSTTGAYSVTATTTGGTGVSLLQGATSIVFGDGTNINSLGVLTQTAADARYLQLSGGTLTGNLGIGGPPLGWGSPYRGFDASGIAYVGSGTGSYITGNLYYNGTNWIAPTTGSGMYCFVNYAGFHIAACPTASGGSTVTPTDKFFMDISGNATLSGTLSCANATASGQAVTLGQASKLITSAVTPLPGPNSFISVAHGLGYTPVNVNLELTCLTADQGYSVGDVIYNPAIGASSSNYGPCLAWANSTNVGVGIASGNSILIINKTTGAIVVPTLANWSYKFVMDRI